MSRRQLALVVALAAVLYAGAVALALASDHDETTAPVTIAILVGATFVVTGAIAAVRRPDNRTGALMLAVGLLWSLGTLQAADAALLFTLGCVLGQLAFAPFAYLILAYPTGRLASDGDRRIVWSVAGLVVIAPLAITLVDPQPLPSCDDCPESVFLVAEHAAAAGAIRVVFALASGALAAAVVARLVRRYADASPPLRRVLWPVYLFSLLALLALVAGIAAGWLSHDASLALTLVGLGCLGLVPVAFLAGILRGRLARGGIADLAIALGQGTPLRDALAQALGDPSLEIAYWSDDRRAWFDAEGRELSDPVAGDAHAATFVETGGRRIAALLHDRSLTDQGGLVEAVAATASLAFEKERLQVELRAQYRYLGTVIATAPSLLAVVDTDGRIMNFNPAVEAASGLEAERLRGAYFWDVFIAPGEREAMIERFRDAAPSFPPASYENVFVDARGQERVIAWQAAPLADETGTVTRIIAGGIEITERKRREEELQRQRDFANAVAETIPSFLVVTDHDADVVPYGVNRAFSDTFGWEHREMAGRSFLELVSPADDFPARMAIAGAANGVPQVERESRWLTRGGGERAVAWTATPILDQRGNARVLVAGTDVTERKRQEEELRASRSRIVEAADAARGRLERNLHDGAQQRLAALSLSLRLAEARLETDPGATAAILAASREELARALDELRELARGLHPNVLTDRGLGPALESLLLRSPIPIDVDVPDERLPPAVEAAAYYLVSEALANVAKYAEATAARVLVVEQGGEVLVQVSDDGVGGADPSAGSGLRGLEDRVAALDGTLEVISPPGAGTQVRAWIPLQRAPLEPAAQQ